jgi:hypothetical protein
MSDGNALLFWLGYRISGPLFAVLFLAAALEERGRALSLLAALNVSRSKGLREPF